MKILSLFLLFAGLSFGQLVPPPTPGGGGGATTPPTTNLYKGNGTTNGVVPATPNVDYLTPANPAITGTPTLNGSPLGPYIITPTFSGDLTINASTGVGTVSKVGGVTPGPYFALPTINGDGSVNATTGLLDITGVNGATIPINQPCAGTDSSGHIIGGTCGGSPGSNGTVYVGASGTQNGVNKAFTLASSQAAILLFKNGQLLQPGVDYTLSGTSINLTVAPLSTDVLISNVANTGSTVSGTLSVPGTTTSGNIVTWNSATGLAVSNGPALVTVNTPNAVALLNSSGELPQDVKGCPTTTVSGSTYTSLNTDCYVQVTTTSTVTLPPSPIVGKQLRIDNSSSASTVTLTAGGTILIQGCNTAGSVTTTLNPGFFIDLTWNGTVWRVSTGPLGCIATVTLSANTATITNNQGSNFTGIGNAAIAPNSTGAGVGGTAACETSPSFLCNGVSGTVKLVTAGVPLAGTIFVVTFPVASLSSKARTCNVFSSGGTAFFSALIGGSITWVESNTNLTVSSVTTPLTTGLTGDIKYQCF